MILFAENFLYWTDEGTGRLERSTLSGQDRSVIYEFSPEMDFSGLALQGNRLYFIERTLDVYVLVNF